jgi:hypothetical protein
MFKQMDNVHGFGEKIYIGPKKRTITLKEIKQEDNENVKKLKERWRKMSSIHSEGS